MEKIIYLFIGLFMFAGSANATLISGDLREELSLPDCCGSDIRVLESLGKLIAGSPDLTVADEIANPSGYSGSADVDITGTGLITLTGREPSGFADYQLADFSFSNFLFDAGESIVGITVLDGTGIFDGQFGSFYPIPTVGFTANSVAISYTNPGGQDDEFNFGEGQTSTFQIQFAQPVPEPATLALFGIGLAGLGFARRKKSA